MFFLWQENFANNFESMSSENQISTIENMIARVRTVITPRNFSFFPQELTLSINIVEQLTSVLSTLHITQQQYTNLVSIYYSIREEHS